MFITGCMIFPCFAHSTCRQSIQYPALLSARTKDLFASGRNCPNSESRSSCPRNRLATSVNTSSSDMPRKGRPLVFSCSFWKDTHRCSTEPKDSSHWQKTHPEPETPMPQTLKGLWGSPRLLQGLLSHTQDHKINWRWVKTDLATTSLRPEKLHNFHTFCHFMWTSTRQLLDKVLGNSKSVQQAEIEFVNHDSNSSSVNPRPLLWKTFYLVSVKDF